MRKETENEETAPEMVDTVQEISYGGLIGTETVKKQFWDLEDYPKVTPEVNIENPIHQRLIEIMHEGVKEIFQPYLVET